MRGSLTGSVVSNILLVLGAAMIAGGDGKVDARSLRWQLAAVFGAVAAALDPVDPAWDGGSPERPQPLPALDAGLGRAARCAYLVITVPQPAHPPRRRARRRPARGAWSLRNVARCCSASRRVATAFVSEIARPLARPLRQGGRAERVLHRGRDRRDRRQRGRARRRGRDRPPRQHDARDRDRDHVVDAGRGLRDARRLPALVRSSAAACRSRSG